MLDDRGLEGDEGVVEEGEALAGLFEGFDG